jgi:integrase
MEANRTVPLGEAVARYLQAISGVRTPNIVANHRSVARRLLEYFPGERAVATLRRQELTAFLEWLTHGRGRFTVNTYNVGVEFLRRLMAFAVAQGWREDNPAAEIPFQEVAVEPPPVLTREEMTSLLAVAAADDFHRLLVGLLGEVGLKKQELLALQWADLELEDTPPTVVIRYGGKLRQKSRRLPLPPEVAGALRRYRERRAGEAGWLSPVVPVTGRQVNNILARLSRAAGIRRVNPQLLRDTAAVRLLSAGRPPQEVSRQLGYTTRGYLLEFLPRFHLWIEPPVGESA